MLDALRSDIAWLRLKQMSDKKQQSDKNKRKRTVHEGSPRTVNKYGFINESASSSRLVPPFYHRFKTINGNKSVCVVYILLTGARPDEWDLVNGYIPW